MFEKAIANAPSIIMVGVISFVLYTLFNMIESSQRRTSTTTKKKCLFCNEDVNRSEKYKYCSDKCHKAMKAKKASDGEKNNKRDSEKSKDKDDGILTQLFRTLTFGIESLFVLFLFIGMIYVIFFLPGGKIYVH